ncbi:hypothetical protein EDC04DRAFT_2744320 [Pisolithus marmoratus]|nr:hypothetical protein EDC04DRAFT_2744320 [Pisolithus marmoratus]
MITLGGNAELELLVDSMDPFSESIILSIMPPKKIWKDISNISGGEKVSPAIDHVDGGTNALPDTKFKFGTHIYSSGIQGALASR